MMRKLLVKHDAEFSRFAVSIFGTCYGLISRCLGGFSNHLGTWKITCGSQTSSPSKSFLEDRSSETLYEVCKIHRR